MIPDLLQALQEAGPVLALRRSVWVYPLVNAGHIASLALLFGAIVPMDLRLLGLWRDVPVRDLARPLLPVAATGLTLAVVTGSLLFSVRAVEYAALSLFQAKLVLILASLLNILLLHRSTAWVPYRDSVITGTSPRLQVAGVLSIGLWLMVIVAGRLIGYFE
jgi:hypothetical protein